MSSDLEEEISCPICFEIPIGQVFQCKNGHTICEACCATLRQCPECRVSYGDGKIRNRALEALLNKLSLDCPYKSYGCKEKVTRGNIENHSMNCAFSPAGNASDRLFLCKELGYSSCEFFIQHSNIHTIPMTEHFVKEHGFVERNGRGVVIHMEDFPKGVTTLRDSLWTPIILSSVSDANEKMLLCTVFTETDNSVSWMAFQLRKCVLSLESQEYQNIYQVQFFVRNPLNELSQFNWRVPVVHPSQVRTFMKSRPLRIPLEFLQEHFVTTDRNLVVEAVVVKSNSDAVALKHSESEPIWIFNCNSILEATYKLPTSLTQLPSNPRPPTAGPSHTRDSFHCKSKADTVRCHKCGVSGINECRYKCLQCIDYDLCFSCFNENVHTCHVFALIDDAGRNAKIQRAADFSNRKAKAIIPFPGLTEDKINAPGVPRTIKRAADKYCENSLHPESCAPVADFLCLECPKTTGENFFCFECVLSRTYHKHHILATINTKERFQFILYQFHKRFAPLKSLQSK